MRDITLEMLMIQSLDPRARLELSEITGQWYVEAHIHVTDGGIMSSIVEHRDTPEQAVHAYLNRLRDIDMREFDHVLVTEAPGRGRQHWRWNGVAFVNEPLSHFRPVRT